MKGSRTAKSVQNRTSSGSAGRKKSAPLQLSWSSIKHDGSNPATSLGAWQPKTQFDAEVLDWAKAIAWQTNATSASTLKRTARSIARHGQHLHQQGVELDDINRVFSTLHVEDTVSHVISKLGPAAAQNEAASLRKVQRVLSGMKTFRITRKHAAGPYSNAEQDELLLKALALPSLRRREELTILLCLTAGAGLTGTEARDLDCGSITRVGHVVWVSVGGRSVPVLSRYERPLWSIVQGKKAGENLLPSTTQSMSRLCAYVHEHGLPQWSTWRATNTWRVFQLGRVPLPFFARSINLSSRHVGHLAQYVSVPPGTDLSVLYDGTVA